MRGSSLTLPLFPASPATSVVAVAPRATLEALVVEANGYAADTHAGATRRAYDTDFRSFEVWCASKGLVALPATPATVAVYLAALAGEGRRPSTIERALAGIAYAHRARGHAWRAGEPAIARVLRGIRRRHGAAPVQKAPVGDAELLAMVGAVGPGLEGLRDRVVLTLGWMGAFRRSELVALRLEDVQKDPRGLIVRLRRSKGDQEAKGEEKAIPYAAQEALCAVRAVEAWVATAGIASGPLVRAVGRGGRVHEEALSDRSVARIVKRIAKRVGLDPATVAGHSLRAGFATTAARKGRGLDAIMRQTLHRSERAARCYIRQVRVFENNAVVGLV